MNDKKKNDFVITIAIVVIVAVVCMIMDVYLGIGAVIGGLVMYFALPVLNEIKGSVDGNKAKNKSFLDTAVLQENFRIPQNLPIAYAVLDIRGHVLTSNSKYAELFAEPKEADAVIEKLLKTPGGERTIVIELRDKYYEAALLPCDIVEKNGAVGNVLTMTMMDITEKYALEKRLSAQETVVAMLFLDNYEEVADTLDESRWPILSALIDRKLTQLAQDVEGVMKKLEKDRYLFLLSRENLEVLKERKFDILNEIREINVGEHIPVTMSIGIGIGGGSLESAMENAKAAVDLALGRGGDQVLIKEEENYIFFGGKSAEKGRNARIRARVKADALWELMGESSGVLVMGHKNGDLDSMGACMGICAIARAMDKKCNIVMNEVSVGIRRLWEKLREVDMTEGLTVKTGEALRMMDSKTLVIVVDTHRKTIVESPPVLEAAKRVVLFDHHRKSTDAIDNAVLVYHEVYASSTCELITEMIQYIGKRVKLRNVEADALLAGITVDTKNFAIKTGAITFETAAFLRRTGADSIRVRLLFQNDMAAYKAKATAVRDAELFRGDIAISVCPASVENSTLTAAQAADDLLNVVGIKASFVCCMVGNEVHISARSFGDINVQRVMEKLGGGGHFTVSGAQLSDCSLDEAKDKIRHAVEEYLEEEA